MITCIVQYYMYVSGWFLNSSSRPYADNFNLSYSCRTPRATAFRGVSVSASVHTTSALEDAILVLYGFVAFECHAEMGANVVRHMYYSRCPGRRGQYKWRHFSRFTSTYNRMIPLTGRGLTVVQHLASAESTVVRTRVFWNSNFRGSAVLQWLSRPRSAYWLIIDYRRHYSIRVDVGWWGASAFQLIGILLGRYGGVHV